MSNLPADVVNQALDAIGSDTTIGDLEEGSREAQVCLRAYGQCLRQLLRAANWDFAKKYAPLTLLADATGTTANVGTQVPFPWTYEYAYPQDCAKVRYIPINPTPVLTSTTTTTTPVTTASVPAVNQVAIVPAKFTIATDFNNLPQLTDPLVSTPGISPSGQTVILTNVQGAFVVYTAMMVYPSNWDPLFRAAFVSYLASEVVLALTKDKKFGLGIRKEQIAITKDKITQARLADGNEGWYSIDHTPDWIKVRATGASGNAMAPATGVLGYGWDAMSFADGSAY